MNPTRERSVGGATTGRRTFLGGCAAVITSSLAGCLFAGDRGDCRREQPPPDGLDLRNTDSTTHTLTVTVIRDVLVTDSIVFEESYELETVYTAEPTRVEDVVDFAGRYVVRARLETEPPVVAEHLWNVSPDGCDGVQIRIDGGRIQFSEPGSIELV